MKVSIKSIFGLMTIALSSLLMSEAYSANSLVFDENAIFEERGTNFKKEVQDFVRSNIGVGILMFYAVDKNRNITKFSEISQNEPLLTCAGSVIDDGVVITAGSCLDVLEQKLADANNSSRNELLGEGSSGNLKKVGFFLLRKKAIGKVVSSVRKKDAQHFKVVNNGGIQGIEKSSIALLLLDLFRNYRLR